MKITKHNNILIINGIEIGFEQNVKTLIEFENDVIVQLWNNSTADIQFQPINNIFAVNSEAKILWNIKDIVNTDGIYTGIYIDELNRLVANEFIGRRFVIDINKRLLIDDKAYK